MTLNQADYQAANLKRKAYYESQKNQYSLRLSLVRLWPLCPICFMRFETMINFYAQNATGYMYNAVYGYLIFSGVAFLAIFIVAFRVRIISLLHPILWPRPVSLFSDRNPGARPVSPDDPGQKEDLGSETLPRPREWPRIVSWGHLTGLNNFMHVCKYRWSNKLFY